MPVVVRHDGHEQVGVLGLALREAVAVEAQQPLEERVRRRQHAEPPAQPGGGEAQRPEGVTHVVLAVAVGALAVLPAGPEIDAGEHQHHAGVAHLIGLARVPV